MGIYQAIALGLILGGGILFYLQGRVYKGGHFGRRDLKRMRNDEFTHDEKVAALRHAENCPSCIVKIPIGFAENIGEIAASRLRTK